MKSLILFLVVLGSAFFVVRFIAGRQSTVGFLPKPPLEVNQANEATEDTKQEDQIELKDTIDRSKKYKALIKTSFGEIEVSLSVDKTPKTVSNFINLARTGFYNNTIFHRVIKDFMIQGGDPKGDGSGGPGYTFEDEPFEGEYTRGVLAMANAGPNTNGSQFFIVHQDYPLLPKKYVIFGFTVRGLDVIDKIAGASVTANAFSEMSRPIDPVKILSIEIIED